MKTKLQEMNEAEFDRYLEWFIPDYAGDLSENFLIPMDKALEESKSLMRDLLPDKQQTVDQQICNIYSVEEGKNVGVVWYNIQRESNKAYIYYILIHKAFRKRGFASVVLKELEETVKSSGVTSMGLNVFGNNPGAQRVYEKLGYQASSTAMGKRI
ncbi:GNAT family N-acetyltransferase [Planococcus salinarum]|uniref:GNAT family N-acetyltransferase n=1 Tax=Planococcus salinarum TaxID=622695 RepID=UPI000E3D8F3F|nr:GNAT family N-acetyltransferase [Planococcus salinarum]TAA67467.1 GNAT family N-acetyltransferase [Planococcus salinarum]